ncbi:hypothetical protein CASFOL_039531 [Castilleja foliolosa]|uniref:CHY-type domain-containing protein n=1 Tax=Castilleja foliolosa TaxID=1961234 RepID=A0ABD3BIP6_9LAMI
MDQPEPLNCDVAPATGSEDLDPLYWIGGLLKKSITSGLKTTLISVLEIGCGNSQLCEELYKDGITELTCIDLSSVAVEKMKQILASNGCKDGCIHYRRRCKIRAPCCNEVYDCRHCHNEAANMLHHICDRHELVRSDVKKLFVLFVTLSSLYVS